LALALTGGAAGAQDAGAVSSDQASRNEVPVGNPPTPSSETAAQPPQQAPGNVVPPVRERDAAPVQKIAVRGFRVTGVADHADLGVTPASIQALADA